VKWEVRDIELGVGILLNDMIGIGKEGREGLDIKGHAVSCYEKTQNSEQIGICVARAIQEVNRGFAIAYPLFMTFKIYENTFELHYYDMAFKFNAQDLAVAVEKFKSEAAQKV